jgi:NAD+ diphosphatase
MAWSSHAIIYTGAMQDTQSTVTQPDAGSPFHLRDLDGSSQYRFDLVQPLDRGHDLRGDAIWLESHLTDPTTEFIPIWRLESLVTGEPARAVRLSAADVTTLLPRAESVTLLGMCAGRACFSVALPDELQSLSEGNANPPWTQFGRWTNVRNVADDLTPDDWATLVYARALAHWHQRTRFCSDCGSPTESIFGGHTRRCANGHQHFPRTDPAIIVLVFSGERCLLGRQPSWPQGRYSTLAGFVEPGETVEQAVAREVYEEAGVRLRELQYFGSQSFPFPASLMLGFHAEAASEDIHLHDGELADARWFTRRELRDALDAGVVGLPPRFAISHRLISAWFNVGDCGVL